MSNEDMEESDVSTIDECAMGRPAKDGWLLGDSMKDDWVLGDSAKDDWVLGDSTKDGWVLGVLAKDSVMSTPFQSCHYCTQQSLPKVCHLKVPLVAWSAEEQSGCRFDIAKQCLYPHALIHGTGVG